MPRPPVLGYLQSAVADNTAHSQMDKLLFEDEMSNIQPEWGTISNPDEGYDPAMEFAEGMMPIGGVLKSLKGVKGSRTLLDDALSKYGKKAHNQIRELIDYDRAIAMDIPEKSHFLQRGISRMFRVVEPDKKKVQRLEDLLAKEDWEEFTEPLMKRTSNLLKGKGTKGMQQGGPAERAPLLGYMNPVFNPEGSGYDMETALDAGLTRDEIGHMGSLDPRTGMVLKGKSHESWNPMVQTEMSLGNTVEYDPDKGRYFSVEGGMYNPAVQDETAHSQMDRLMFENEYPQSQYSIRTEPEPWQPKPEDALPIGGALRLLKGSDKYLDMLKSVSKTAAREKKNIEAISDAHKNIARAGERGQMKGTPKEFLDYHKRKVSESDKNIKDYAITKWIQRLLQ